MGEGDIGGGDDSAMGDGVAAKGDGACAIDRVDDPVLAVTAFAALSFAACAAKAAALGVFCFGAAARCASSCSASFFASLLCLS